MEYYVTQPNDYWIAPNAVSITLNALGEKNRIQGSVASGAVIMCFIEDIKAESAGGEPGNGDGLWYGANHEPKRWPLSLSPTYFNSDTRKYVYVAIPRSTTVGTQAVIVFPSEKLDIYGRVLRLTNDSSDDSSGEDQYVQVGSTDYFYVYLQGIIGAADAVVTGARRWEDAISDRDWGILETAQGRDEQQTSSEWYTYSTINQTVTFLKKIFMSAGSWFQNLIIGSGTTQGTLTGVATDDNASSIPLDSKQHIVTPSYLDDFGNTRYLSKIEEDTAAEQIGFLKGLWIKAKGLFGIDGNGNAKVNDIDASGDGEVKGKLTIGGMLTALMAKINSISSSDFSGHTYTGRGWAITNNYENGRSRLTIDELYVRARAIFEELVIKQKQVSGGDTLETCAASYISRVDYLDENGSPMGYTTEKVPWTLNGVVRFLTNALGLTQILAKEVRTRRPITEEELEAVKAVRCYFLASDGARKIQNWWQVGDLAFCQTLDLDPNSPQQRDEYAPASQRAKYGNIRWWRRVYGVSSAAVTLDDGKQYHYFDVKYDYEAEGEASSNLVWCELGSDIPAANDAVVQLGHIPPSANDQYATDRMNALSIELNGAGNQDAPCVKMLYGIYTYDLTKCWFGGSPVRLKFSPKTGNEVYGPSFKIVTMYDTYRVPTDRGQWSNITPSRDDYGQHGNVRKCYFYDRVSHNGSLWLCREPEGQHWTDSNHNYISDSDYAAMTTEQQQLCTRVENYTTEEPGSNAQSTVWEKQVEKGANGNSIVSITKTFAISALAEPETGRDYPSDITSWSSTSPAVTDAKPYLWLKEDVVYTDTTLNATSYYYVGMKGDNGVDAQDVEWVYIRTMTNTAPTIKSDSTYTDTNGKTYTSDDHLPQVNGNANIENNENKYQCTDNPKGVTDIWKYEWEIKRTKGNAVNGKRSWNYYTGSMTLHNSVAESALIIDINNDSDQFGTDSTGKVLAQQARSTIVSMMYGTQEQAFAYQPTYALRYDDGTTVPTEVATVDVTPTVVGDNMKYTVTVTIYATASGVTTMPFATHGGLYVDITGSCAKGGPKTIRFTLERVMSGAKGESPIIYQLNPTSKDFVFNRLADNSLTPANRTTTVNALKTVGNTTTDATSADNLTFSWGFDDSSTAEGSGTVGNSNNNTISVTNTQASSHYQVWVQLSTGDRETLPIVKDGTNGAEGKKGNDAPYYKDTFARSTSNTYYTPSYIDRSYGTDGWGTTPPSSTDTYPYIWKRSQLWDPNTEAWVRPIVVTYVCLTGAKGANGKDGWMVTADPANVILTESLSNNTSTFTTCKVGFTAKKGNVSATVSSIGTPTSAEFVVAKGTGDDVKKVVVSSAKSNGTSYYTEGTFTVAVNVTDPDTNTTVTFSMTVPCYANLLGTWQETVKEDTKREVANTTYYVYDKDGQVVRQENIADYIRSSSMATSTLTTEVDGVVTDMSEIDQTSKKISLSVYDNQDLLSGNLLSDTKFLQGSSTKRWNPMSGESVKQDGYDNYFKSNIANDTSIIAFLQQYLTGYANRIEAGNWYTLSFYTKNSQENILSEDFETSSSSWVTVRSLHFRKSVAYNISFRGFTKESGYSLRCRVRNSSTGETSSTYSISNTTSTTGSISFTPSNDGSHVFEIQSSYNGVKVVLEELTTDKSAFNVYINGILDTSESLIVDGNSQSISSSSQIIYFNATTGDWVRHTITFKTASSLASNRYFSFRRNSSNVPVCIYHPRLEVGTTANEYGDEKSGLKRTGIDIEKGKITAVTDNFEIQNSSGDTTFSIDQNGNLIGAGDASFEGTIKSKNFYHSVCFWDYNTTDANTGDADLIFVGSTSTGTDRADITVKLPTATDYSGKIIEIIDLRYIGNTTGTVGALNVQENNGTEKHMKLHPGDAEANKAYSVNLQPTGMTEGYGGRFLARGEYWVKLPNSAVIAARAHEAEQLVQ